MNMNTKSRGERMSRWWTWGWARAVYNNHNLFIHQSSFCVTGHNYIIIMLQCCIVVIVNSNVLRIFVFTIYVRFHSVTSNNWVNQPAMNPLPTTHNSFPMFNPYSFICLCKCETWPGQIFESEMGMVDAKVYQHVTERGLPFATLNH